MFNFPSLKAASLEVQCPFFPCCNAVGGGVGIAFGTAHVHFLYTDSGPARHTNWVRSA